MVRLSVSSSATLTVTFQEPQCLNSTVVTKYRGTHTQTNTKPRRAPHTGTNLNSEVNAAQIHSLVYFDRTSFYIILYRF